MHSWIAEAVHELLDAVYPPRCPVCGEEPVERGACAEHVLPLEPSSPRCGRCGLRIADSLPDGATCAACRADPPAFRRTLVLGDYREEPGLRDWVLALKHRGRADLAGELGAALGALLARATANEPALLVPVPLHPLRRFERKYDQALLLARAAARSSGVRIARALRRVRWSGPQGEPGAVSRRANVDGAFRPRRMGARRVAGRSVWLVDDVLTSGATANECARALKRLGAREVSCLVVARVSLQAASAGSPARGARAADRTYGVRQRAQVRTPDDSGVR